MLGNYVWRVRSAPNLDQHTICFPSGYEVVSKITALGWCAPDIRAETVYICLSLRLETVNEPQAVATILHELAHALVYAEDESWWTENRSELQDEIAAWTQVAHWAARNIDKPSNGGYAQADEVMGVGLSGAFDEFNKWAEATQNTSPTLAKIIDYIASMLVV